MPYWAERKSMNKEYLRKTLGVMMVAKSVDGGDLIFSKEKKDDIKKV
jgi:hypothetical protein